MTDDRSLLAEGIAKKYQQLEEDIMLDVIRRIKKAGKITETADWQLFRYRFLGRSSEDIQRIVSEAVGDNTEEIRRIYTEVIESEYTVYKRQYEEISGEFLAYENNYALQQLTESYIRNATDELSNITRSMGFMIDGRFTPLSDIYNEYLDQAVVNMTSGAFDYNSVIRKAVRQLTNSGLRTVDYDSGWHNRVDVAARRAILTGVNQLAGNITDMNAEALGIDQYEVSWHYGARPEHAKWQGRVYDRQGLIDICGLGTGPGLQGWNCRHSYYLFFPGSERTYTDRWLAEQNAREQKGVEYKGTEYNAYQATQRQRELETQMRAQREKVVLLREAEADPDNILIERCKYQTLLNEYKGFCGTMGLQQQRERIYYDLRGRIAPTAKQYAHYMRTRAGRP